MNRNEKGQAERLIPKINYNKRLRPLHKLCMQAHGIKPKNIYQTDVDHVNHNRFDCRLENLRYCDSYQNNLNRVTSRGVTYVPEDKEFLYQPENDFSFVGGIDLIIDWVVLKKKSYKDLVEFRGFGTKTA